MNEQVTQYIAAADEKHQPILQNLRKLILEVIKNVNEEFKWSRPVYAITKDFCYLKTTKKHVTLGFFEFEKIQTNKHLLEGTGKSMRHIKLSNLQELAELEITKMLQEAIAP